MRDYLSGYSSRTGNFVDCSKATTIAEVRSLVDTLRTNTATPPTELESYLNNPHPSEAEKTEALQAVSNPNIQVAVFDEKSRLKVTPIMKLEYFEQGRRGLNETSSYILDFLFTHAHNFRVLRKDTLTIGCEEVAKATSIPLFQEMKSMLFKKPNGDYVAFHMRGDEEVNEEIIKSEGLLPCTAEELGLTTGRVNPISLKWGSEKFSKNVEQRFNDSLLSKPEVSQFPDEFFTNLGSNFLRMSFSRDGFQSIVTELGGKFSNFAQAKNHERDFYQNKQVLLVSHFNPRALDLLQSRIREEILNLTEQRIAQPPVLFSADFAIENSDPSSALNVEEHYRDERKRTVIGQIEKGYNEWTSLICVGHVASSLLPREKKRGETRARSKSAPSAPSTNLSSSSALKDSSELSPEITKKLRRIDDVTVTAIDKIPSLKKKDVLVLCGNSLTNNWEDSAYKGYGLADTLSGEVTKLITKVRSGVILGQEEKTQMSDKIITHLQGLVSKPKILVIGSTELEEILLSTDGALKTFCAEQEISFVEPTKLLAKEAVKMLYPRLKLAAPEVTISQMRSTSSSHSSALVNSSREISTSTSDLLQVLQKEGEKESDLLKDHPDNFDLIITSETEDKKEEKKKEDRPSSSPNRTTGIGVVKRMEGLSFIDT